jgi:hypothetical protein
MFPGPGATIYRNEAGEPLGWSYENTEDPPDVDPYDDFWDGDEEDDEEEA